MSIAILRIKYFGVSNLPKNYADNSKQKRMQTGFDKRKNKKDSLEIQSELFKMSLLYHYAINYHSVKRLTTSANVSQKEKSQHKKIDCPYPGDPIVNFHLILLFFTIP